MEEAEFNSEKDQFEGKGGKGLRTSNSSDFMEREKLNQELRNAIKEITQKEEIKRENSETKN